MYFDKKSAIKTFYYLIAADGEISPIELQKFDEIAMQIDEENFKEYRNALIEECDSHIGTVIDAEDYYDVIQEGIYKAIQESSDDRQQSVPTRLVVWNMLAISYADSNYSEIERRLIRHIVRLTNLNNSVFLEMESMIRTAKAVESELEWLNASERPYSEIRPLVDEIAKRRLNIQKSAKALIEDEILFPEPIEEMKKEPTKFEEARDQIVDKTKAVAGMVGEKTKEAVGTVGTKSKELFNGLKNRFGNKKED
ncbi:MAG: hypothetical protein HDT13_02945 [Butyrivibrio sp.]|nr:hypothetical protein [Butyrivibrio sp.]